MRILQVGSNIKKYRLEKSITQEELANYLEVSTPAISKWENDQSYPEITLLPKLAKYFGISIDNLVGYVHELSDLQRNEIIHNLENLIDNDINKAIEEFNRNINEYSYDNILKLDICKTGTSILSNINCNDIRNKFIKNIIKTLEDIIKNTDDIRLKEETIFQLSAHYAFIRDFDTPRKYLDNMSKSGYDPESFLPLMNFKKGNYNEGRKILQEKLKNTLNDSVSACFQLGVSYLYEDSLDIDKSIAYLNLSIDLRKIESNMIPAIISYTYLAYSYLEKNDYSKSLDTLNEISEIFDSIDKYNKNEYYYLTNYKLDINKLKKEMIPLLNSLFVDQIVKESKEFKKIINILSAKK